MLFNFIAKVKLFHNLIITLKYLDSVPSLLFFGHFVNYCLFNMSNSVLNNTVECVHWNSFCVLGSINCSLCRFHNTCALQSRNFNNLTAKLFSKCRSVNLISALLYNIHHINGNNNRDTELCKLCCKVKVTLKVSTVNNVKDCVRSLLDKVVTSNYFFKCVRRK